MRPRKRKIQKQKRKKAASLPPFIFYYKICLECSVLPADFLRVFL